MKTKFFFPAAFISLFFMGAGIHSVKFASLNKSDTSSIDHKLDGTTDEWPEDKFASGKESSILIAIDNDTQNLYLAMKIPDIGEQMKLMDMGMKLFIDLKGKHKQNIGVEFPVIKDNNPPFPGGGMPMRQTGGQGIKPDIKKLRMMLAANLASLKLFGFTEGEVVEQDLETENSAQIAFDWDTTDVMQIEYLIPLKMLDQEVYSLDQRLVSIGWKINGIEAPVPVNKNNISNPIGGVPNNGVGKPQPGGYRDYPNQPETGKMTKEQEFWIKYTFIFPSVLKGF